MKLLNSAKRMLLVVCIAGAVLVVAGAVYYRSFAVLPFAGGVLLGVALNISKIMMLNHTVQRAADMETKNAANIVRFQQLLRFVLTGGVLVLAALVPFISLWGAAAGILTYQIAAWSLKRSPSPPIDENNDTEVMDSGFQQ